MDTSDTSFETCVQRVHCEKFIPIVFLILYNFNLITDEGTLWPKRLVLGICVVIVCEYIKEL